MIKTDDLSKSFLRGDKKVIAADNINIEIADGIIAAFIGHSGSGKSSLVNMLGGMLKPDKGSVLIDGRDIYSLSENELCRFRNKNIGIIPQNRCDLGKLTVKENILLPVSFYMDGTVLDTDIFKRADDLMQKAGIYHLRDCKTEILSGGEQRRVSVVRAMIQSPHLLLADEPTNDLDEENSDIVIELLKTAAGDGATVILVTHEKDILPAADEIYRIEYGKCVNEKDALKAS